MRRLLPVAIVLAAAVPIAIWWSRDDLLHAQARTIRTAIVGGLALIALVAWFAFLAPVSRRVRAVGLLAFAGAVLLSVAAFRFEGVDGDLVPVLSPRWTAPPAPGEATAGDAATAAAATASFPRFLGPGRDGAVAFQPADDRPPRTLWRRPVGAAWSGYAVADGRAVTQEQDGGRELVTCADLLTGKVLWSRADPGRYDTTLGGVGPRATPSIADGRVYAVGGLGLLQCLDLATGARVWSVDLTAATGSPVPMYGFAASPLVEEGLVVIPTDDSLAAFDRATGELRWKADDDRPSYASPAAVDLGGVRQIVQLHHQACAGHDPATGAVLWRFPWRGENPKAAQPVAIGGGQFVVSAGYGVGADAFRVSGDRVEPLWRSLQLRAKFSNFVHFEGRLYGLSDGLLVCVDAATGERVWRGDRYGHGQLLRAGRRLVVLSETGAVAFVDAAPGEFVERARFQVLDGKTWNSPALAGPFLLVRNDREAACLELAPAETSAR